MKRLLLTILLFAGAVFAADTNTYRGFILAPGATLPIVNKEPSDWSQYIAVQNVDMGGYSVTNGTFAGNLAGATNYTETQTHDGLADAAASTVHTQYLQFGSGGAGVIDGGGYNVTNFISLQIDALLGSGGLTLAVQTSTYITVLTHQKVIGNSGEDLIDWQTLDLVGDWELTNDASAEADIVNWRTMTNDTDGRIAAAQLGDFINVDTDVNEPDANQVLTWNGTIWSNAAAAAGTTLSTTGAVSGALSLDAGSNITITQTDKVFNIASSASGSGDDFIWVPASEWSLSIANPMEVGTTTNEYGKIVNIRNADRSTAEETPIEFMKAATAGTAIDLIVEGYSADGATGIVYFTAQEDGQSIVTSGAYNVSAISITNKGTFIWDDAFTTATTNYIAVSFQFGLATTNQGTVLGGDFSFSGITIRQQP